MAEMEDLWSGSEEDFSEEEKEEEEIPDDRTLALFDKVFGIELLRDKILKYAIHEDGPRLSRKNTLACRGVQRDWLEVVTRYLLRAGEPLFKFTWGGTYFSFHRLTTGEKFTQFLDAYTPTRPLGERMMPFELVIFIGRHQFQEKMTALRKCFRYCSEGLVKLTLKFGVHKGFSAEEKSLLLATFEQVSFPALREFAFGLYEDIQFQERFNAAEVQVDPEIITIVQLVLSACKNLTSFWVKNRGVFERQVVPGCKNIRVPSTLKKLTMSKGVPLRDLEHIVGNNSFPLLTDLAVTLPAGEEDILFRILESVSGTLRTFKVTGTHLLLHQQSPLRLPRMRGLQEMYVRGGDCDWVEHFHAGSPDTGKLTGIQVYGAKGIQPLHTRRFEAVGSLGVTLAPNQDYKVTAPLTAQISKSIDQQFLNVTKLHLGTTTGTEIAQGLAHVFENMGRLQVLSISSYSDDVVPRHLWSSFLTGRTPKIVEYLESCRNTSVNWRIWTKKPPLIAKLAELREFSLGFVEGASPFKRQRYLSDDLFEFAFFQMPKLRKIQFWDNITGSSTMLKKWQEDGREIQWKMAPPSESFFK